MIAPRLDSQHAADVRRQHGPLVAELLVAYRDERARREQLAAAVDELLDVTPATRRRGLVLIQQLDELLHHDKETR